MRTLLWDWEINTMTKMIVRGLLRIGFGLLLFMGAMQSAHAQSCVTNSLVTLTGNLRSANGLPSSNSVITLTPSQQGYIAGCGVNLPQTVTCGTSTDGSVIGVANPLQATGNTASGSGTLPAGTYYSEYIFENAAGQVTLVSPETRSILSVQGSLVVNPPASGLPSNAINMLVYIGTTSGGETLQGQTSSPTASWVQSVPLVTTPSSTILAPSGLVVGSTPGTTNTTACQVTANDAMWPVGTGYKVGMTDANGNAIPGYPMQWQLMGANTTINISNGLPYYHGVVYYPIPLLVAPTNHGLQSITGPLSLSGYNLLNAGKVGIGTSTPGWPLDVENGFVNSMSGYLANGNGGTVGQAILSDGTAFDTPTAVPSVQGHAFSGSQVVCVALPGPPPVFGHCTTNVTISGTCNCL